MTRGCFLVIAVLCCWPTLAQESLDDIDTFMAKVLEQRKINWDQYYNYFCRERASLEIEGTLDVVPIQGFRREYLWFVRDGHAVRSPISVDGVRVSPEERERAERRFIERAKKRERKRGADRETFFGFELEPGNYFFAGEDEFEGRKVVVVEYYPESAFGDDDEDEERDEKEAALEAKLNKVLLVTMLIDPEEHQIVKMTLDNVGFDFLPASWLFQLDTVEASLTMHQPLGDVWLAREIEAYGRLQTASGDLSLRYQTVFHDCARSETGATYRFGPRKDSDPK